MSSSPLAEPRRVALLGSTGSIGRQAIDVLAAHRRAFRVVALAAGTNGPLLAEQAARLRPAVVALADEMTITAVPTRWSGWPRARTSTWSW
jgi:1-deoxy-D-xylulose-5-phosphate reductoisomerase